jgi:hypothetical protein
MRTYRIVLDQRTESGHYLSIEIQTPFEVHMIARNTLKIGIGTILSFGCDLIPCCEV